MSKLQTEEKKKQYETYVKEVTPVHNLWMNMAKAFLVGGLICTLGQFSVKLVPEYGDGRKDGGNLVLCDSGLFKCADYGA